MVSQARAAAGCVFVGVSATLVLPNHNPRNYPALPPESALHVYLDDPSFFINQRNTGRKIEPQHAFLTATYCFTTGVPTRSHHLTSMVGPLRSAPHESPFLRPHWLDKCALHLPRPRLMERRRHLSYRGVDLGKIQ